MEGNEEMMEASREAVAFEPQDIMELAEIIVDHDEKAAYEFLKERVYKRIVAAQAMRIEHARLGRRTPQEKSE
jgi:hypothetical protein